MPKRIMTVRKLSNAPKSKQKREGGGTENLYEVSFRGIKLRVTNSMYQEMKEVESQVNDITTGTEKERRKWAKAYEKDVLEYVSERQQAKLASFLSRMPDVVEGMLKATASSGYFDATTTRYVNEIINMLGQMDEIEREEFYRNNGDLFADMTDYYNLLKRYGGSPNEIFALEEADLDRLHQKGYSSFEEYKKSKRNSIKMIRDKLKKQNPDYYNNYKSGKYNFSEEMQAYNEQMKNAREQKRKNTRKAKR